MDENTYDDFGAPAGTAAVEALLTAASTAINSWNGAAEVVDVADDAIVRAALKRLLALHMFGLQRTEPHVAARNVEVNDLLRLGGVPYRVRAVDHRGEHGETVYITARLDRACGGESEVFVHARDVELPLIERPAPATDDPAGTDDVAAHTAGDETYARIQMGSVRVRFDPTDRKARSVVMAAMLRWDAEHETDR